MTTHIKIARHLSHVRITILAICTLVLLSALLSVTGLSVLSQDMQSRVVKKLRQIPMPVEIKIIKHKKGTVEIGRDFPDEDDWFEGLAVSVKNTSGKTIIYMGGGFLFPRPQDEVEQSAPPRYHRFMYGQHPLAAEDAVQTTQPINIKPGESFDITIAKGDYSSLKQRLKELGYKPSIKEINFNIEEIYFADGTGWSIGSWYQRDPKNKKQYKRVEKPPDSGQIRLKDRTGNAFSFVKARLAVPDSSCWADDGFLSVSCTTTSPSNTFLVFRPLHGILLNADVCHLPVEAKAAVMNAFG